MATDDQQRLVTGVAATPATFTIPGNGQIRPKAVFAHYDGTNALVPFQAALKITSDAGKLVGVYKADTTIVAGASADVSWAPFLRQQSITSGSGIPPFPALDDYVFKHANTTVTGVGLNNQAGLIIQGNPVALDGLTRVKIEFFAPLVEIANANAVSNQAIGFSLWDGLVNKGVIGYVEAGNFTKNLPGQNAEFGGPVYGVVIDTPAAGTHTYAIYAFINVAAGGSTNVVYANTFVDGTGNLGPCWYRMTTT